MRSGAMQLKATICRNEQYGALSARELERVKRKLSINLGLAPPHTNARRTACAQLKALEAALVERHLFERIYPARADQVRRARHAVADFLSGCPRADEATLISSEMATNAVLHSASRDGGTFTVRVELYDSFLWIEVEDAGGPWRGGCHARDDESGRGLELIEGLCADENPNWGVEDLLSGGRVVWARLVI
jgi:anti-sigma regulatory factor (Ser/Thr protein kinase)